MGKGRLDPDLLERVDGLVDRCPNVVDELERQGQSRRILDQLTGSATAVGANLAEGDEALSRKDFCKHLAIALKELNETRYWLRLIARRGWVPEDRLASLAKDCDSFKSILGAMLTRTRANAS